MKSSQKIREEYEKLIKKHVLKPWAGILLDNTRFGYPHTQILINYFHYKISFYIVLGLIEPAVTIANDHDNLLKNIFDDNNFDKWSDFELEIEALEERDHWFWVYDQSFKHFKNQIKKLSS